MSPLRINCGSGQRPFKPPWINVDIQERWKPDVLTDWNHMPMFEDGSADIIVAHHTIEHVGCGDAHPFFREAYRILQPGGSLIITVPNLRTLAQRWLTRQLDDYTFFVNVYGAYMGHESDRHRWAMTMASLSKELLSLEVSGGFSTVKYFDWRPIAGADIVRAFWILGVEAVK